MTTYPLGLVVGKFAPLHAGHEALVAFAAARCERLLVLSYTRPGFAGCGAAARRAWLAERFPTHDCVVIDDAWLAAACAARGLPPQRLPRDDTDDATQQRFLAWLLDEVLQRRPDAMFASEPYLEPCAQVLSERFGQPVAAVGFDRQRRAVPVSGTRLRADPDGWRQWLAPSVQASLVQRVCLLGGESSGKTSLAAALAKAYGDPWVPEYGRELWALRQGRLDEADLLLIAREQQAREERALSSARRRLFCDTSALTTLCYSLEMFGRTAPELQARAERRYDLVVLCEPDFAFVQDGTRRDAAFRARQHAWTLEALQQRGWPFIRAAGPLEERLRSVAPHLPEGLSSEPD
ncbi:AAA family ATPase [Aquabacterium sp. A7-Y]|uniref:AAA family ATPase n=1 Tax=Aquabacterium sp. A7-Y TaxID=1349605 RepID=UPI00223E2A82|nr:AAA family ATPase [Aquabacterium sp. A7-Y]MCW7537537.1 AAA family ATPase [Aquabacterium sp. A7-Y]